MLAREVEEGEALRVTAGPCLGTAFAKKGEARRVAGRTLGRQVSSGQANQVASAALLLR